MTELYKTVAAWSVVERGADYVWPTYIGHPQTLPNDTVKNPFWLAWRGVITGAGSAGKVPLHKYGLSFPSKQYRVLIGELHDDFKGNEATAYGELNEPYARAIVRAVFSLRVTEYGLFFHRSFGKLVTISPDGVSNSIRVAGVYGGGAPFDLIVGPVMVEIKCSPKHQYTTPLIYHIVQCQLQMYVCETAATLLTYLSKTDRGVEVRIFWLELSRSFLVWMMRRLLLFCVHVERRVPIAEMAPYFRSMLNEHFKPFPYLVADELAKRWFDATHRPPPGPILPPLTLEHWDDEMAMLGMTREQWDARPGHAMFWPTRNDAGQLAVPAKPNVYLVYEMLRPTPPDEPSDLMDDPWVIHQVDENNAAYFEAQYRHVTDYAAERLRLAADGAAYHMTDPKSTVPNMFITSVQRYEALDRPEPVDQSGEFATVLDRFHYLLRVAGELKRYARQKEAGLAPPPTPRVPLRTRRPQQTTLLPVRGKRPVSAAFSVPEQKRHVPTEPM